MLNAKNTFILSIFFNNYFLSKMRMVQSLKQGFLCHLFKYITHCAVVNSSI